MGEAVLFGALHNGSLVVIDPFNAEEWQNANLAVFGQSGSGKSFFLKCILARLAPRTRIYVIDPDGEYSRWAQHAGAQHVFLTSASLQINPFDLTRAGERQTSEEPTFFREKLVNLITFLGLLVGTQGMLEQQEKSFLYRCLVKTYALYGITNDPQTHRYAPPCVADFYRVLCSATGEHDPYQVGVDRYQLAARLEQYLHLFPEQTTFTFNHPHLVFNVQQLAKSLKPVATFLITERLWTELSAIRAHAEQAGATASASLGHSPHSIVMIDEAWFLASFEDGANFLAEFARRIRKYGGGLWVGTQRSGDFLQSEQGKTLLAMCAAKLLFRHDTSSINEVTNTFRLHAGQRDFLLSAPRGEALLLTKVTAALEIVASPREQEMANTTLGVSSPPTPLALPAARPSTRFDPLIPEQGALHEPDQPRRRRS